MLWVMPLTMRDSIYGNQIPNDTPVVAGYGDGRYIWSPSWQDGTNWFALFPNSVVLVIVVSAADSGDILDVENGDATPAQVPGWCDAFNRPGRRAPTVYCNRSAWPGVIAAVGNRTVDYWISTLDGTMFIPGAVAVQYVDNGPYDSSVVWDPGWAALNPFPQPPSPTHRLYSSGGSMIACLETPSGRTDIFVIGSDGALWWHVGMGAPNAMTAPGVSCGGDVRAVSATYWSDYSAIDVVTIDSDGSTRLGVGTVADQTFRWQTPVPGPALTPVGYVPPGTLPSPLK
jgi:hypothetical protein